MTEPDFQTWLDANGIDIQTIEPEVKNSLLARFKAEQQVAPKPVAEILIIPSDLCQWPMRGYWLPTK